MEYSQLAWYIGGPLLGLCVVAMRWLLNERLGLTGAWSDVAERLGAGSVRFGTRGWLLIGLMIGAVGFAAIQGGPSARQRQSSASSSASCSRGPA